MSGSIACSLWGVEKIWRNNEKDSAIRCNLDAISQYWEAGFWETVVECLEPDNARIKADGHTGTE